MAPRGFGYTMASGFIAWVVSTMAYLTIAPDKQSWFALSVALIVVPVAVTKIAQFIFRNH